MKEALLLADLHLHHLPTWRLDWCENFITMILEEYGGTPWEEADNGSPFTQADRRHLYILGDVIEIRDKVDSRVLNLLIRLIKGWNVGDVVWLSGQHDSYLPGKATLYELEGMKLKNGEVFVVDNSILEHDGYWFVPFQRRDEDYRACLDLVPDDSVVLTHMPTKEIIEMYGAKDVEGISVKEFSRFKKAISGDIHKFYDFPELSYVGAPSQRDWRDKGVIGQIATLQGAEFTRIPTTHPMHIEIATKGEIPEEGEYIIKTKRGSNIQATNVIGSVESSDITIESMELTVSGSMEAQLDGYISVNPPPGNKQEARAYADDLLAEEKDV